MFALLIIMSTVQYLKWRRDIDRIGGPPATFLKGTVDAMGPNDEHRFERMRALVAKYPRMFRLWLGPVLPQIIVVHPDTIEPILGTNQTEKSRFNPKIMFHLSEGTLAANGPWWKEGRKLYGQ